MTITPDSELKATERRLCALGAERVSFRAGQVLQYQHQLPRGYFVPMTGSLLLLSEGDPTATQRFSAQTDLRLFPDLAHIHEPLPYTLQAETDITLWFFSRFLCQPCSTMMLWLEELHAPGNPLFNLWSHYVPST